MLIQSCYSTLLPQTCTQIKARMQPLAVMQCQGGWMLACSAWEAPTPYLQKVAAAAACISRLEGCDSVLGLLGVCAGSDELLLQSTVLQKDLQATTDGGWHGSDE